MLFIAAVLIAILFIALRGPVSALISVRVTLETSRVAPSAPANLLKLTRTTPISPASHPQRFSYKHVDGLDAVTDRFVGDYKKDDNDKDNARYVNSSQSASVFCVRASASGSRGSLSCVVRRFLLMCFFFVFLKLFRCSRAVYTKTTETFYNLITDFYEYGWGQSFHFGPKWASETFEQGIKRYEHWFASQIGAKKGMRILDVGCGIGGPLREIWRFSQATITGVNITKEHIQRAIRYNARDSVTGCDFIQADFNEIPVPDNTFEGAYDMEATLHSTDRARTFKELFRVLKPGAKLVSAQYCLLDAYNDKDETHREIIRQIDNFNGCYCHGNTVASTAKAFTDAGFKIIMSEDVFDTMGSIPFHSVFVDKTGGRFFGTKLGRAVTTTFLKIGEAIRLLPKGTVEVQNMLIGAADSFTEAGNRKLLTPGYVFLVEKPAATA
jgi:sterol 24-C-methyltransferase